MKKILFAIPQLAGGGAERVTAALAGEISRREGYEVHIAVYTRDSAKDYPVAGSVIWHCLPAGRRPWYRRIPEKIQFFRKTVRTVAPDFVVSLAGPEVLTLLALGMAGCDVSLCLSERNDPRRYPKEPHLRILRRWVYGKCDGLVFQTREAMEYFPRAIRKKSVVIGNPLTGALPERYEDSREKRIVTACRLNAQKNLPLLLDAFSDLAQEFPEYTLDIYGEGPERERLEEKIKDMGLLDRITLRGFSDQVYDDIRRAALFVLPSDYEGISNSMLEAVALGVPTVCTDCPAGGARETIVPGVNGLLVPVGDRAALADAMRRILCDDAFAEKISREGVKLRDHLSVSVIAQEWLNYLNTLE